MNAIIGTSPAALKLQPASRAVRVGLSQGTDDQDKSLRSRKFSARLRSAMPRAFAIIFLRIGLAS
ncbi:MAG: hypothetical protein WCK86_01625 [Planctomycetia bacterium]